MIYKEFTGKTVKEAVENGLRELGLTEAEADVRVLEEGKKKLFGSVKARVEIAAKTAAQEAVETEACVEVAEKAEKAEKKAAVATAEKTACAPNGATDGERAVVFLEGLFELLHITAATELVAEGEKVEINVTAANSNAVIGKRGVMLDAIQTLAGAVANTGREDYKRVVVDCEGYREKRETTLQNLAENLAQKAVRMGRKIRLEAMNPYERRIIHAALSDYEGVKTESEGKEPNRYIVIVPNNLEDPNAPAIPARSDRDRRDRNSRGGYNRNRDNRGRNGKYGNSNRGGYNKKPYNRDKRSSSGSGATGGTSVKKSSDFFGIFLGNSGNDENN